uniref:uncharacterized protein LOC124065000 isoform X2 n=1 Tax=Scatophagus argus TaxID=75038 RepID=UPI001ED839E7|nr:uncharacterized protein LOC124065000 isoform X2 [Scatophagus argus]
MLNEMSFIIFQVETMATKKILSQTLNDLSSEEFKKFKSLIMLEKGFPLFSGRQLKAANTQDVVELMVTTYRQESVVLTKKVLKMMNMMNLAQRLSAISLKTKEKQQLLLPQRVEMMVSVIRLLLETLKHLSDDECDKFKEDLSQSHLCGLDFYRHYLDTPWMQQELTDIQDMVFSMVLSDGQMSVETIKDVLKKIKRTDLVQRLSRSSSGSKQKHSVDEHLFALIHKVATMTAVKEVLLETLNDLSHKELKNFRWLLQFRFFQRSRPHMSPLQTAHSTDLLVELIVDNCGQQSVEVTKEVFIDMNKTDQVQKLSEPSSGPKEKNSLDEDWPTLKQEVENMASVTELLLEPLKDLSDGELVKFKGALLHKMHFRRFDMYKDHSDYPLMLEQRDVQDTVFLLVQSCGRQSVETVKEVLKKMKRTDLVQRLSDSSSGLRKERSAGERHSALIQRVATIAAVKEVLLETLNNLSVEELEKFKDLLQLITSQKHLPDISSELSSIKSRAKIVDLMVQTYGQQSVWLTMKVFMDIQTSDLVQGLAMLSLQRNEKRSVDEHQPAKLQRTAAKAIVKNVLWETLSDLSHKELKKFKWLLQFTYFQKSLPQIPHSLLCSADRAALVDLMVKNQQAEKVTKEVLMDMNRTDLVQRLSESSPRPKEKCHSEQHWNRIAVKSVKKRLLETLEDLSHEDLKWFKRLLHADMKGGHPRLPREQLKMANRVKIVELMVKVYGQASVQMIRKVLRKMSRRDLVHRLSDIRSGSKVPPKGLTRRLVFRAPGSSKQVSSDWTKLEPEVCSTGADEAPTYSLQSEAGRFECSVSGLRWVCEAKISFKYQFCSWEEPMERMESLRYMPAGPLMDITVTTGKLDEVYLPHWIFTEDDPKISDKFAVLHIDDCGDVVEKVSEVTASHVKLPEPVFSPRAVLIKAGFPVKISCNVLIYQTNTAFLTLHIYLIPRDPGLQQKMNKRELSYGCNVIRKPPPERSLKMGDRFALTADVDVAEIYPKNLKLRYDGCELHFFEVHIENPDTNFKLNLTQENEVQPAWICVIRKDEYKSKKSKGRIQGEQFVDEHRCELIEKVSNIGPILDKLLRKSVIKQESYDTIWAAPTTQEKMRTLYSGPLNAGGREAKDIFYKILEEEEPYLVAELERKEA